MKIPRSLFLSFFLIQFCYAQNFNFSAYIGKNFPSKTYLTISQDINKTFLKFDDVKLTDKSFEFPLYYGVKLSYNLNFVSKFLFAELEFIHSKVYSDQEQIVKATGIYRDSLLDSYIRFGDIVQNFSISHGLNYLLLNFGYKFPALAKIYPYFKFGAGISIPHFETTVDSLSFERYEVNDFVIQLAGGANLKLYKNFFGFLEFKYTQGEILKAGIFGGTADTNIKMFHFVFGLGYTF